MIILNLLNPKKQKNRRRQILFRWMKNGLELLVVVTSVVAIVLVITRFFLIEQLTTITVTTNVLPSLRSFDERVRELNRIADTLTKRQTEFHARSPLLLTIARSLPPRTQLQTLTIDEKTKLLTMTGSAQDRRDILELERKFQGLEALQNVVVPLTTFFKKEKPEWTLTARLAP